MSSRILIVDDHAVVRRMLRILVETHEGWEVCAEASNGEEGIAKAVEHEPDIVIMDMAMPVKDGISASREIAARLPAVPIVMHTLHYSTELELEAKKAGAWAVVPKAEASDELLKTIAAVLSASRTKANSGAISDDEGSHSNGHAKEESPQNSTPSLVSKATTDR